jgi:hypothetical protein
MSIKDQTPQSSTPINAKPSSHPQHQYCLPTRLQYYILVRDNEISDNDVVYLAFIY